MEDTVDIKIYNNPTDRNQQQILNDSEALFIFETSSENIKNDLQMFHPRLQSDLPHGEHYEIGHINLGIALIFNHKNIADESTRRGTEKDRDRLKAALNKYGFDVRIFDDLSYSEIMKTLQYIANVEDHSSSDCLMVTVMSHGLAGKINAADLLYEVKELWQPFMGDRCRSLIGKPKMFFIQYCDAGIPEGYCPLGYANAIQNPDMSQAKSLQELQNEVGALLQFRDLVIETFPGLKDKMTSLPITNCLIPSSSSSAPTSRREWEPGIRTKKKPFTRDDNGASPFSFSRSRSNSHNGKKESKGGDGHISVIQDSGFSTETNSSKDTPSTSTFYGFQTINRVLKHDEDDELLNLLDVVHRKAGRLREDVEYFQHKGIVGQHTLSDTCLDTSNYELDVETQMLRKDEHNLLKTERDNLIKKLGDAESEIIRLKLQITKSQIQLDLLTSKNVELQEELVAALELKDEMVPRLPIYRTARTSLPERRKTSSATRMAIPPNYNMSEPPQSLESMSTVAKADLDKKGRVYVHQMIRGTDWYSKVDHSIGDLGRLDVIVAKTCSASNVKVPDSKKLSAILMESSILELRRQLLMLTVENQILLKRLQCANQSNRFFMKKLKLSQSEVEEIRRMVGGKKIDLKGAKGEIRSSVEILPLKDTLKNDQNHKIGSLCMEESLNNSSSTESAQDQIELDAPSQESTEVKPSRIPLLGLKCNPFPKPLAGKISVSQRMTINKNSNSIVGKVDLSSTREASQNSSLLNRSDSAQNMFKESLSSSRGSSLIPISSKSTPSPRKYNSPLPKPKRDTTSKHIKRMESFQQKSIAHSESNLCNAKIPTKYKSNVCTQRKPPHFRKDLMGLSNQPHISNIHINNKQASCNTTSQLVPDETDSGKVRNLRSTLWNWLKI